MVIVTKITIYFIVFILIGYSLKICLWNRRGIAGLVILDVPGSYAWNILYMPE